MVLVADFAVALLAALGLDAVLVSFNNNALREREGTGSSKGLGPHGVLTLVRPAAVVAVVGAALLSVPGIEVAARMLRTMEVDAAERARQAAGGSLLAGASFLCCLLVLGLFAGGHLRRRAAAGILVAVTFAELAAAGSGLDRIAWDPAANMHPDAMSFLLGDAGLYRIEVRPEAWGWWSPSAALLADRYDAGGVYDPLEPADYQLYWEGLTDRQTRRYDFLNVKYVVAPKDFALPWGKFVPVFDNDPHLAIFLNTQAMPRATLVGQARAAPSHDAAWQKVQSAGFDPSRQVVVEGGRDLAAANEPAGTAEITGYRPEAVEINVSATSEAYLVLADVYYPGWHAAIDGVSAPVLRADYAFRAVLVPPGTHAVRFWFRPASVLAGAALSAAAALALIGLVVACSGVRVGSGRGVRVSSG
jgi:hypothetical protein